MFNKQNFYDALAYYHGIKWTVTHVEEECYYREGCPTCGGDYEYSLYISGVDENGNRQGKNVDGRLSDFINSL